jgi:hypothetical protein
VLREIVELSKTAEKSADLLKVLHNNDLTNSLVEVPCSAKQSGFKKQARMMKWMHCVLKALRRFKNPLVNNNNGVNDNDDAEDKIAHADDNAARWLITHLGKFDPVEFVKSAQASHMPVHKGKMNAEHAAAMWCKAGVGVAAQRVMNKHFISCFGCKFTAPEAPINELAVHAAPPIVGRTRHLDHMLDCWCNDLVVLLTGQIANEHDTQPEGFSHKTVDFVVGADHGQGSSHAGVKVICRKEDNSIAATAVYEPGEIECKKDTADLIELAFTPKLNAELKGIVDWKRNAKGKS